jgi:hypothetical protein
MRYARQRRTESSSSTTRPQGQRCLRSTVAADLRQDWASRLVKQDFRTAAIPIAGAAAVDPQPGQVVLINGTAGADKSSAQVISLIIDPGPSAVIPRAPALFTWTADWRHHDLSCCCAWPTSPR